MSHHVIYVPGLGDQRSFGQNIAIEIWRLYGLHSHYFPLGWSKNEGLEMKLERLIKKIDSLTSSGHKVSLVGISAGASAVMNAYSVRGSVRSVVLICGKINNPETISERVYDLNPDFKESVLRVKDSINKLSASQLSKIMFMHPWKDHTVPIADTKIKGAKEQVIPGWSHISGIFFGVILYGPLIARFVKTAGKL